MIHWRKWSRLVGVTLFASVFANCSGDDDAPSGAAGTSGQAGSSAFASGGQGLATNAGGSAGNEPNGGAAAGGNASLGGNAAEHGGAGGNASGGAGAHAGDNAGGKGGAGGRSDPCPGAGGTGIAGNFGLSGSAGQAGSSGGGGSQFGLRADYYDGAYFIKFVMKRIDPNVNLHLDEQSPAPPLIPPDKFSIRWTGTIRPRFSEAYTFSVASDDGSKLHVNDQLVIDRWRIQAFVEASSAPIQLAADKEYPIKLEYFDRQGAAGITLSWQSASEPKAIIPAERLKPADMRGDPSFRTYEAEADDVVRKYGADIQGCNPCSPIPDGQRVDLSVPPLPDDPAARIEFNNVVVCETRQWTLRVWYSNEGPPRSATLLVNDDAERTLNFRTNTSTGYSSVVEDIAFSVELNAGFNRVVIVGPRTGPLADAERVRIDRITVE